MADLLLHNSQIQITGIQGKERAARARVRALSGRRSIRDSVSKRRMIGNHGSRDPHVTLSAADVKNELSAGYG